MAEWQRCAGSCKRVLGLDYFDAGQTRCRACVITDEIDTPSKGRKGPAKGSVTRPDVRARSRAVKRLIEMHKPQYERLLAEEKRRGL